jgi:spermidine synthase
LPTRSRAARPGRAVPDLAAPFALAALCFLLSGAGSLIVETVWMRWLRLLLGATAPAASATLVAFFSGQAVGAALAAWAVPRLKRPLRTYGLIELLAVVFAAAVPAALGLAEDALTLNYDSLRAEPGRLALLRFGIALGATFPAALAFGATLPTLAAAVVGRPRTLGSAGTGLYALHTLGAAGGAALAAFTLPPMAGVRGTYFVGLGAIAAAGGLAWAASHRWPGPPGSVRAGAKLMRRRRRLALPGPRVRLALAATSGFASFAAQVLLVQAFGLVLDQSVQAFGAVLVSVLLTLGLGAGLCAVLEHRGSLHPDTLLRVGLVGAALGLAAFPGLFVTLTRGLAAVRAGELGAPYSVTVVALAVATAGPGLFAAALVFPATIALEGRADPRAHGASRLGRLLAVNTVGAIAGALAAPYLLLPTAGLWGAIGGLSLVYGAATLLLPAAGSRRLATLVPLAAGGIALAVIAWPQPQVRLEPGEQLEELKSTPSGLVAVVRRPADLVIETDNHYTLGGVSQQVHQQRQAHVPLLLHGAPRRVAYIGSATGISAGAALLHPVESLSVVELVPEVAALAQRHFAPWNRGVYSNPRTEVVLDDGRNFLRTTSGRFDVVIADLFVPWRSGAGALYTREHFTAVRERLAPGGLFCQWLPLYQLAENELLTILVTFLDVFPKSALFRGDFYGRFPIVALVGWPNGPPDPETIDSAVLALAEAGETDRWVAEPLGIWSLYVAPTAGLEHQLGQVPRNLDDHPVIEFESPRHRREKSFVGLPWVEFTNQLAGRASGVDPLFGALGPARSAAAEGGRWLQLADALWASKRPGQAAEALAEAAQRLPPGLFSEAPPDPTAAVVWHDLPERER